MTFSLSGKNRPRFQTIVCAFAPRERSAPHFRYPSVAGPKTASVPRLHPAGNGGA